MNMCVKVNVYLSTYAHVIPLLRLSHEKVSTPLTTFKWWFVVYKHEHVCILLTFECAHVPMSTLLLFVLWLYYLHHA